MTQISIRQSGGSSIISIPKAVLASLNLNVGDTLELALVDNNILLSPAVGKRSLEDLLAGSPKKKLQMTEEDREWLSAKPVGKEII